MTKTKQCYLQDRCSHLMASFLLYVKVELDIENKTRSSRAEHMIRVLGSQGWWAETSKGQQIFCVICIFSMPSRGFCTNSVCKEYLLSEWMNMLCAAGKNQEQRFGGRQWRTDTGKEYSPRRRDGQANMEVVQGGEEGQVCEWVA